MSRSLNGLLSVDASRLRRPQPSKGLSRGHLASACAVMTRRPRSREPRLAGSGPSGQRQAGTDSRLPWVLAEAVEEGSVPVHETERWLPGILSLQGLCGQSGEGHGGPRRHGCGRSASRLRRAMRPARCLVATRERCRSHSCLGFVAASQTGCGLISTARAVGWLLSGRIRAPRSATDGGLIASDKMGLGGESGLAGKALCV